MKYTEPLNWDGWEKCAWRKNVAKRELQLGSNPSLTGPAWRPLAATLDARVAVTQKALYNEHKLSLSTD